MWQPPLDGFAWMPQSAEAFYRIEYGRLTPNEKQARLRLSQTVATLSDLGIVVIFD